MSNYIVPLVTISIVLIFIIWLIVVKMSKPKLKWKLQKNVRKPRLPKDPTAVISRLHDMTKSGQVLFMEHETHQYLRLTKDVTNDLYYWDLVVDCDQDCIFNYHVNEPNLLFSHYNELSGMRNLDEKELYRFCKTVKFIDSPRLNTKIRACEIDLVKDDPQWVVVKFTGRYHCSYYTHLRCKDDEMDDIIINLSNEGRILQFAMLSYP
jgi:hypothetical protein